MGHFKSAEADQLNDFSFTNTICNCIENGFHRFFGITIGSNKNYYCLVVNLQYLGKGIKSLLTTDGIFGEIHVQQDHIPILFLHYFREPFRTRKGFNKFHMRSH